MSSNTSADTIDTDQWNQYYADSQQREKTKKYHGQRTICHDIAKIVTQCGSHSCQYQHNTEHTLQRGQLVRILPDWNFKPAILVNFGYSTHQYDIYHQTLVCPSRF